MKTIIAGSRSIKARKVIEDAIQLFNSCGFTITELISGTAVGVDQIAELVCKNKIPINRKPANWDQYGKRAGYLRNQEMAKEAEALIAIWDGLSKGTRHMVEIARKQDNVKVILLIDNSRGKHWLQVKDFV